MADERFADDTLFVIFEGDYTLLKSDEDARLEWDEAQNDIGLKLRSVHELAVALPDRKSKAFKNQYLRWYEKDDLDEQRHTFQPWPASRPGDSIAQPKVFPKAPLRRPAAREASGNETIHVEGPPPKEAMYANSDHSSFLLDVVDIANIAGRNGCGDFVWLGWDASHWSGGRSEEKYTWKVRKESPTSGAHLSLVTTKGARFLMERIKAGELPKGHMGHQFIFWLNQYQGNAKRPNPEFGASYIVPPLGGYMTHGTTWMKKREATLNSHWTAKWMQEGSRTEDFKGRQKVRKLVHYRAKGPCEEICQVNLPCEEDDWWYTQAPDGLPDAYRGVQDWHRPRVIEDPIKICGCLSSVARNEPVAVHFSCCTQQFEFEVDRSLIAEPSPKH